jgi:molybdopterin synthase sulfur carrier subunit
MKLKILCFGITRDIIGQFEYELELTDGASVADLKAVLNDKFPSFQKLTSLRIALNTEYAQDSDILKANDEIVLIPPVSGG